MRPGEMGSDRVWRPAAALPRRVMAGVYTGSRVLLIVVPLKLLVYGFVRASHSPNTVRTFADLGALHSSMETWAGAYYLTIALIVIYAFLVRPIRQGATWGQERFGIVVEDLNGDTPDWRPATIRFLVHLGWLVVFPLGLIYLAYSLHQGQEPVDLTDHLSKTRQFADADESTPLRQAIGQAFFPGALALILQIAAVGPLSAWMMLGYRNLNIVEKVEPTLTPAERHAARIESVLKAQRDAMRK
jgi:uncharacterized RDD family membrane protein YckC